MALYSLRDDNAVLRVRDGAIIPNDPANSDRRAYEAWLHAGNVPDPVTPMPAPTAISGSKFINRLTPAEQMAICTKAQTTPQMLLWMIRLAAADDVDLNDPEVRSGVMSLVGTVLTNPARAREILAP